jgi:hypothetical protein
MRMNSIKVAHRMNGFDRVRMAQQLRGARTYIRSFGDTCHAFNAAYLQHKPAADAIYRGARNRSAGRVR